MKLNVYLKKGFSLIELLVVVAIIGILAAIGSIGYTRYIKISQDKVQLANLVELMEGLGTTYIAFKTNQINSNDTVFSYCSSALLEGGGGYLNDGFAYTYNPDDPPLDCIGSLTVNFKSPYNEKDIGGINGNYILSPCMPVNEFGICDPQPLVSYGYVPSNNPSKIKCDGPEGCSSGFQYSDGTAVTTEGKIFYTDFGYTSNKPDGSKACRIVYFQACHADGNEDDGILILNSPCYGPNPDPNNQWEPKPDGSYGYSMPNVKVNDVQSYLTNNFGIPKWTGAKIIKTY